jgi:hypothetical protein
MLDLIVTIVASTAATIVANSIEELSNKYSVDVKYVLDRKVKADFQKCIELATKAFFNFISQNINLKDRERKAIIDYLQSSVVTEEISHLLDPGSEIFDRFILVDNAKITLFDVFGESTETIIFDAWNEFIKAFSFASRSAPELREFLRASYEAGSFKALSNIEDVLDKMNHAINNVKNEELTASNAIKLYAEELKSYQNWAANFQVN